MGFIYLGLQKYLQSCFICRLLLDRWNIWERSGDIIDTSKLIGKIVKHVTYGSGKIAAINDKYIQIIFDRGESKRFQFPQVFVSYLKIEDTSLMSEILMEEQKRMTVSEEILDKKMKKVDASTLKIMETHQKSVEDLLSKTCQ